jgi:hypothetical protein
VKPWWERFPGLYEREMAELDRSGVRYERNKAAWSHGVLQLDLWPEVGGREVHLMATYPDLYPFFRFEVVARRSNSSVTRTPLRKAFALSDAQLKTGRSTTRWPGSSTIRFRRFCG